MTTILKTHDLSIAFGGVAAVNQVNIEAHDNELIGLIGPNGAGKTTLFNLLTGVYQPTAGTVTMFDGQQLVNLNGLAPHHRAQRGMARTFQNIRLFTSRTVLENVLIAMTTTSQAQTLGALLRTPKFYQTEAHKKQRAMGLLAMFDMTAVADELAGNLPYGQQRRLEIVRALATEPKILFLDEPAAGMNPQETAELTQLIRKIQREFQITIVLIEHDMSLVMDVCERIYVLEYGQVIAHGTPIEIKNNPRVIQAYLGGDL